jgi:hypothetical protein
MYHSIEILQNFQEMIHVPYNLPNFQLLPLFYFLVIQVSYPFLAVHDRFSFYFALSHVLTKYLPIDSEPEGY